MFLAKIKENYHNFSSENYHFKAVKNRSILHGRVFVMVVQKQYLLETITGSDFSDSPLSF